MSCYCPRSTQTACHLQPRYHTQGSYKQWKTKFLENRQWNDRPFNDTKQEVQQKRGSRDSFLLDNDTSGPTVIYRVITQFCDRWEAIPASKRAAVEPARAWLDFQSCASRYSQSMPKWLTAAELTKELSQRFADGSSPKSYRQLLFIRNLDPDFIDALADTAWFHQVQVLRDALCRYLDGATTLRVHFPLPDNTIFRLELHLSRLVLKVVPIAAFRARKHHTTHEENSLFHIDFLGLASKKGKLHRQVIRESRICLVVCGWDHSKWSAFGFTNSEPQLDDDDDENTDDDHSETSDEEGEENVLNEDELAADAGFTLAAGDPIWDPRLYWLIVARHHVRMMTNDWSLLVHTIIFAVKIWRSKHPFKQFSRLFSGYSYSLHEALAWTGQTSELLCELHERLSTNIRVLDTFLGPQGDIGYFGDLTDSRAIYALDAIKECSLELVELEGELSSFKRLCQETAKNLALCMGLESSHASLQDYRLNENNYRVALETHTVAFANNMSAGLMFTSNQFLAPFIVVTGYFSTQEKIFGFSRNATSFSIGVCIVFLVLRVVLLASYLIRRLKLRGILAGLVLGQWDQLEKQE